MSQYWTHDLILHLIIFQIVILAIFLSNQRLLKRTRQHPDPAVFPRVSILVPARNEQENIAGCVESLLAQDYPAFEVLVYDDQSSDATPTILTQLAAQYPQLKLISGAELPEGHYGKNWACSRLADQAAGDVFFFTDADTLHSPQSLRAVISAFVGENTDLLTGFPRQQVQTWGERLLVPFFSWASLCFIPLGLAYRVRLPALVIAVGQMLCISRAAYQAIGGHQGLGTAIAEDLALARKLHLAGLRWRMARVSDLITCRMYRTSREAVNGFSKNLFAAFDFRLAGFLFVLFWLLILFLIPLAVLVAKFTGAAPLARISDLTFCIGLSVLLWWLPLRELGIPLRLALLYPLIILANVGVALRSLFLALTGRIIWKGRNIISPRWKWF